uniref:KY-like immunoglobulin-like domain-containing protein n=1 Tax=Trichobilharzia regenti TaxID=157069 RepID=A0AA85K7Q4_TRIRE|nr:unnamed protein product [Trichobilharzia regenti]
MGSKLSCMSKQKEGNGKIPKQKPPKILKKKKVTTETVTVTTKVVDEKSQPHETTATPAESGTNHVVPTESAVVEETVKIRPHITVLEPAPSNYKLPEPLPASPINISSDSVKPNLEKTKFTSQLIINKATPVDSHIAQPVDPEARELAKGGGATGGSGKPANWADLHWALIGKRNLQTDELKVRALFSWLCSIPVGQTPFLTYEELQQAERDGVQYAKEALANKSKKLKSDSPEFVLNEMSHGKATYLQAFESLCHYSHIPCVTVKGLAKGVDYVVGMRLSDPQPVVSDAQQQQQQQPQLSPVMNRLQHAWNAAYLDGKWALFDPMWAAQRLAVSANTRLSQLVQSGQMDYETDMFYFNVDPAKLIYSHFPFDDSWQMLNPPVTLKQFENSVLLKPAFFRHGLGLLSHQDCVILAPNKLVIKLSMPRALTDHLKFTFNLKYEEKDDNLDLPNLSQFGLHELSRRDATVTFHFRFPKPGAYKLTLYAQRIGEKLFADICEYRVESRATSDIRITETPSNSSPTGITIPPFPPTSQAHYGPAEKAQELGITTVPSDLEAQLHCRNGVLELRFTTKNPQDKLPRLTALLKSLIHETKMLTDCILIRTIEGAPANSISSVSSRMSSSMTTQGPCVHMIILTVYFPTAGEYALEVYAAPAESDEKASYFLVWQFLIDSELGVRLSTPVRKRLATMNLGPQDETWSTLGLKLLSHHDPLIHVPTAGGSIGIQKTRSKSEIMSQYMSHGDKSTGGGVSTGDSLAIPTSSASPGSSEKPDEVNDEVQDPRSYDLKIKFLKESQQKIYVVGQFVDISTPEEEDCTTYLLQQWDEPEEPGMNERLSYLIRIPKGDHFYKLYLYATPVGENELPQSLPLVYTYLIEAPPRIMASEMPYIGVKWGAFPEKLEQQAAIKQESKK